MNDQNHRSAAEVMANAARVVKAAVNIVRAAIAGGLHGAAAAAAKELLPTIIKLAVGVLIAIIVIPMFVISAMPNMFFGYETSEKDSQITMREQALSIGGAYLSLEDFEKTQQDAIITGEAAAYENQGVTIDEIRVSSKFDEEDLCWYIAINSVAHKQDLSEMKPEEVQSLLISNLKHTTRLESSGNQTVLRIIFQPLDKDKLMDDLEFDEDAKTWAGALFETIYESDALNKYKDKFEAYKPNYAGDTGYTGPAESSPGGSGGGGGAESGGSADNTIDISGFTNPRTKNNHDLAAYAIQAWEHGWGYVWGTFGTVLTESMLQYKLEQYLHKTAAEEITCETPCYPAYITRDIYAHNGYDVLILVEDDLAQFLVNRYIDKNRLDFNKRIQVLPVGGYDNTLDLHQNFLQEEILQPVSHIISIIDGDAESAVLKKKSDDGKWGDIPSDTILFLPVESLEKYLKKELFDKKNYTLMRLLRDRLFKFETEVNWFEQEYLENIENKRKEDVAKGRAAKKDPEYFTNGKNLFSILSEKYENQGHSRKEFREKICSIAVEYLDSSAFEEKLTSSLSTLFKR